MTNGNRSDLMKGNSDTVGKGFIAVVFLEGRIAIGPNLSYRVERRSYRVPRA
jgi:hypothetical protein